MRLKDQVALITGAGTGIGRTLALRFAQEGAHVAVNGLQVEPLEQVAAQVRVMGRQALLAPADVSSPAAVKEMMRQVLQAFGQVDILVNNAANFGPTAPVWEVPVEQWDTVLAVNLRGALLCTQGVLPGMIQRHSGVILNMSSVAGKIGYPLRSPYCASKWALIGLTRTMALELGPYNIRVNALCPGPVEGENIERVIATRAAATGQTSEQVRRDYYLTKSPLGRMVTADDVAHMAIFLASDQGKSITGQAININAGYEMG
ncbi:MAG: SDR family oxidoreductase [Deinococcus sp.]|nr:SDR family oxidoreductase [Deinococcus sp.]